MITIPAAFIFLGLSGTAAAVATGTFGLGFNTLPVVFAQMGPLGNAVGAAWFFMLFLAAITSSISMYQPAVALLKEALGWNHKKATGAIALLGTIGALLTLWFTEGGAFWSTMDFWVGTFFIFVMATAQIILFSWVFGIDRGWREIHAGASIKLPGIFKFVMKYVAPVYLLVVFVGFCVQNLGPSITAAWANTGSRMAVIVMLATFVLLFVVVLAGEKRWRAAGIDIDDKVPEPE
jgi:SNF family Na+-dependent transporter